ncbi:IclR family transcriptional regulator [Paralimibaculum aggregatum]|uniref:IclR family transcriptional regulator n=1 Tax=Paralimibaculum aggregatum TaxID=3036245 RepID=A0ABQ6LL16_9RHOB|nr:IclR family transcriptional regulator [Limibaculum sp. NKW23]GMG83925.1 IclR family transcriptional regulator [Limibaculum sp. NKW23]
MDGADKDKPDSNVPTNLRLLLILERIAKVGVPVTPTEINEAIGLPKPTIHRLFATLEAEGFLMREVDGRSYSPGRRLRNLSVNVLSSLRVRTARLAVLGALAEEIGETCNIAVPDREAMIYLDRVETKWPLRIQLPVGTEVPFYCTASGKMYLSTLNATHLKRYLGAAHLAARTPHTITDRERLAAEIALTRERGHSEDAEEFMEGMIAIAMPILDDQERLLATVSFHAPTMRLSLAAARSHVPRLRQAAAELSHLAML